MARAVGALVALLVVVSGCSTLPGTADGPPGTTLDSPEGAARSGDDGWPPTTPPSPGGATPIAVSDVEATRLPPSVAMNHPPGVAPDGIYDVDALAASHERRLSQTSYTLEWRTTTRNRDGTVRSRLVHRVESNPRQGRIHAWVNETGPAGASERAAYRENGTSAVRADGDGPLDPPATASAEAPGALRYDPARTADVAALLQAFDVAEVRQRRTTDGTRYLLLSERLVDRDALTDAPDARVSNASLVALLDASAVVRRLRVEYDVTRNGSRTHRVRRLRVGRVGTTVVTRPGWAGDNATTPADDG